MKAKIYRTLERFNDDNSGTFEAIALIGFFSNNRNSNSKIGIV